MSDLPSQSNPPRDWISAWFAIKKFIIRLQDWFAIQTRSVKLGVLATLILIVASSLYFYSSIQKQTTLSAQARAMEMDDQMGGNVLSLNDQLPVLIGTGSALSFRTAIASDFLGPALTLGLLAFVFVPFKGQFKSLKLLEVLPGFFTSNSRNQCPAKCAPREGLVRL